QKVMATLPSVSQPPKGNEPPPVQPPQTPSTPATCRPNPLFTACQPDEPPAAGNAGNNNSGTNPSVPSMSTPPPLSGSGASGASGGGAHPVIFDGDGNRSFSIIARTDVGEARCVTPCQLYLPPGKVQLAVTGPVRYTKELTIPPRPSSVVV